MKKVHVVYAALFVVATGLFAFTRVQTGSIKGTVTPAEAAKTVWAMSATDTLKASVTNGSFEIMDAKPGSYRLIVEANDPYKNQAKDNVTVTDGQATDVGEIKMEK